MKLQKDTQRALGLLLIVVLVAAGSLAACNSDPPAVLNPEQSYTAEKVRVQWLIADKTTVEQGGLNVTGATTLGGASTLASLSVTGATALDGGLTMDTNKFTVADTTGAVSTASNLTVGGTAKVTGATTITGTLAVGGVTTLTGGATAGASVYLDENELVFDLGHTAKIAGGSGTVEISVPTTGTVELTKGTVNIGSGAISSQLLMNDTALYLDTAQYAYLAGSLGTVNFILPTTGTLNLGPGNLSVCEAPCGTSPNYTADGNDAFVAGFLEVSGNAYVDTNLHVWGDSIMTGTVIALAGVAFDSGSATTLAIDDGTLTISATETSIGGGRLVVEDGLDVTGSIEISENLTITGDVELANGTLAIDAVTGDVTLAAGTKILPTAGITNTSAVFSCVNNIAYTQTTTKTMCIIPANANIIDYLISIGTAFNDSGDDYVDCGTTYLAATELYSNAPVNTEAVGRPGVTTVLGDVGVADLPIYCVYQGQNGNSSAGLATLVVYYIVD